MKASEASKKSEEVRSEREEKRKVCVDEHRKKTAQKDKEDRAQFVVEFNEQAEESIAKAVKEGKTSVKLYVGYSRRNRGNAEDYFTRHVYVDIIDKTVARLKRAGFSVTKDITASKYFTNYEAGDMDTDYTANYKVSWK